MDDHRYFALEDGSYLERPDREQVEALRLVVQQLIADIEAERGQA